MNWLNYSDKIGGELSEPQTLIFWLDSDDRWDEIPVAPRVLSDSKTQEWIGLIGERPVVIQRDTLHKRCATVLTRFTNHAADWEVLRELEGLPAFIRLHRPRFIESRTQSIDHVVYRPDPRGWLSAIYRADSKSEAEALLQFLRQDEWNQDCVIGDGVPEGTWTIARREKNGERDIGCYTNIESALSFASSQSLREPDSTFAVKNIAAIASSSELRVARGRVTDAASGSAT